MKKIFIGAVFGIVSVIALVVLVGTDKLNFKNSGDIPPAINATKDIACSMEAKICPDGSVVGRSGVQCTFAPCPDVPVVSTDIRVISPHPNDVIKSPVKIQGEAKGTWYSEGSFPVSIVSENGAVLGRGIAEANGDWMTTEFVPFEVTIDFIVSSDTFGSIVLSKDNPSGLPENDARILIPIRF